MPNRGNTRVAGRLCIEEDCERPAKTRGLCAACWLRYKRAGLEMPPRLRDLPWGGDCGGCRQTLAVEDFTPSMQRHGGYCRDCMRDHSAATYETQAARDYHLQRKYGLTHDDVVAMVEAQDGCAICHTRRPAGSGWQVDHDHACCPDAPTCGQCVRGILCHHCNLLLGNARDDVSRLIAAIEYLEV